MMGDETDNEAEHNLDANQTITLSLVSGTSTSTIKSTDFHPAFTYTFLGEDEEIVSKTPDLTVSIKYAADSLYTYCDYAPLYAEVHADTANYDEYLKAVVAASESWKPFGTLYHSYKIKEAEYVVYQSDATTPNILPYHRKLQTMVLFFIEGASYCNIEEYPLWQVYTVYKKDGDAYSLVGFVTAYQFYAYPDKIRYRISQFFIVPPCQRMGHGQVLYEMIYGRQCGDGKVAEITVEDPNDDFQGMRDVSDVKGLIKSGAFEGCKGSVESVVVEKYRKEFKLNKRQMRRCAEIIMLSKLNHGDVEEVRQYRIWVKTRIYLQNKEALEDFIKVDRVAKLDETYRALIGDYQELVERL